MGTTNEPDYMKQDEDFLDHQFEVNPHLYAGLSSERDKEWQRFLASHAGKNRPAALRRGRVRRSRQGVSRACFRQR